VAIERFPTGHLPGIMVVVDNVNMSLKDAIAVMAHIMGVQP
jgi:hypothetical protein